MAVATEMNVEFDEVRYLKTPPDEATLRDHRRQARGPGGEPRPQGCPSSRSSGSTQADYVGDADAVVAVLLEHPKLLQRPVIVTDDVAIIGRPLGDAKAKDRVTAVLS